MSEKDGGPAFPQINRWDDNRMAMGTSGLSMRDYFAAKAMQGLLACGLAHSEHTDTTTARSAYAIADAMLAERAKSGGH